jgi:hypothetical protein
LRQAHRYDMISISVKLRDIKSRTIYPCLEGLYHLLPDETIGILAAPAGKFTKTAVAVDFRQMPRYTGFHRGRLRRGGDPVRTGPRQMKGETKR